MAKKTTKKNGAAQPTTIHPEVLRQATPAQLDEAKAQLEVAKNETVGETGFTQKQLDAIADMQRRNMIENTASLLMETNRINRLYCVIYDRLSKQIGEAKRASPPRLDQANQLMEEERLISLAKERALVINAIQVQQPVSRTVNGIFRELTMEEMDARMNRLMKELDEVVVGKDKEGKDIVGFGIDEVAFDRYVEKGIISKQEVEWVLKEGKDIDGKVLGLHFLRGGQQVRK